MTWKQDMVVAWWVVGFLHSDYLPSDTSNN